MPQPLVTRRFPARLTFALAFSASCIAQQAPLPVNPVGASQQKPTGPARTADLPRHETAFPQNKQDAPARIVQPTTRKALPSQATVRVATVCNQAHDARAKKLSTASALDAQCRALGGNPNRVTQVELNPQPLPLREGR